MDTQHTTMTNLSVIIPIYPDFQYLTRALNSLRNQNIDIFEVICVLDGFEDYSEERRFMKMYNDFRLVFLHHKENRSSLQARITGCKHVRGDIIAFLDKDDEIDRGVYGRAVQVMNEYNADIVRFGITDGIVEYKGICKTRMECIWFFHHKYGKFPFLTTNYIYKASLIQTAIQDLNIPEDLYINLGEDILMTPGIFCNANVIVADPSIGNYIYHKDNEHSITKNGKKYSDNIITVHDMVRSYCFTRGITKKDIGYKETAKGIPLYDGIQPIIPENWVEKSKKAHSYV